MVDEFAEPPSRAGEDDTERDPSADAAVEDEAAIEDNAAGDVAAEDGPVAAPGFAEPSDAAVAEPPGIAGTVSADMVAEPFESGASDAEPAETPTDPGLVEPEVQPDAESWESLQIAGRYAIGEPIGESRLGWVYRAWDSETEQDVEVTFLYAAMVAAADDVETRLEELRGLQHLHVLPLLHWELHPAPCLVYPAPTMRLQQLIGLGAALTPSQALLIGLQAAETLHGLRERGITHGALTPWHCCIDITGRLRLAGMGLDFLSYPDSAEASSRYSAPETIPTTSRDEDATADVPDEPDTADAATVPADFADADVEWGIADETGADAEWDVADGVAADAEEDASGDVGQEVVVGAPAFDPGAADVYGLGLLLAEAAAGRPLTPAEISSLGMTILPPDATPATARHLARLAPLLAQASAAMPEQRLDADELALALRATAEMMPPPRRLDEAFQRVEEHELQPVPATEPEPVPRRETARPRNLLVRLVAAAAVVAAAVLLVVSVADNGGTPSHTVPDVVGMSWSQANRTLSDGGWAVRRLEVRVPDVAIGEVIGQLPEPGGLLDEGQVVKVQISLGEPLVVVPADIVGMSLEEAGLRLSAIGLRPGSLSHRFDVSVPDGAVVAVSETLPELPRGSTVDLVIAVHR